jgi:acyl carrier protein
MDEKLFKFIADTIIEANGECEFDENTLLLEDEILDSVSILYLVTQLEEKYNIQIPLEDIIEENFKNITCIVKYVKLLISAR